MYEEPKFIYGRATPAYLTYKPEAGVSIDRVAYEVYEHVRTTGQPMRFVFNNVQFIVRQSKRG